MSDYRRLNNPVILKEIRTRMRGNRAFLLLTAHLFILVLAVGLVYAWFMVSLNASSSLEQRRIFGKVLFGLLLWMELVMVSFIAPALTSGMISSERERQTFDLMRVTLLSPSALVLGKYASGLVFVFLLLFTSIPLNAPAFLLGGILPEELGIGVLILAITAVAFCALGMFFSSLLSRTLVSTTLTYTVAITLVFGLPMVFLAVIFFFGTISSGISEWTPVKQATLLCIGWLGASITPVGSMVVTEVALSSQQGLWLLKIPLQNNLTITLVSPWVIYVGLGLLLSIVLLWASVWLVKRKEE